MPAFSIVLTDWRLREQARSHKGICVHLTDLQVNKTGALRCMTDGRKGLFICFIAVYCAAFGRFDWP